MNLVGQHIGNYVILKQLGAGGMGTVYLAEHPVLGRKVAIKVLHDEHTLDADLVARFFQEARAAAAIGEQHIIDVVDAGEIVIADRKICYLMMEVLDGKSLGKRISQGPIPPEETAHIIRQVCMALAASHEKGIIHRDLKPENIYLCPKTNDAEFVKVLDFGIAKLTGHAKGSGRATRIGTVLGTPAYMSPEQCVGIADVDPRADIYALGIVMFEMLTGVLPFEGDIGDLIEAQLRRTPLPPSTRNPAVPPAWDAIVMHCLEKARDDRFQTMDEVDAAIADPAAHLAAYQQMIAERAMRIGSHKTAVLPPELQPDHIVAARAAARAAEAEHVGVAVAVPTPRPIESVPLIPLMPTVRAMTPTPMPGPLPQGTPAPFMTPTIHATPLPTEPARRRWPWLVMGLALVGASIVFVLGLLAYRAPSEERRPIKTELATTPPARADAAVPVSVPADAAVVVSVPADAAVVTSVAPIDASVTVHLTITTEPVGAKVAIQRGSQGWSGASPYVAELEPADTPLTITVSAPGYRTATKTVTARKDSEILIVLPRVPIEPKKPRHSISGDDLIKP